MPSKTLSLVTRKQDELNLQPGSKARGNRARHFTVPFLTPVILFTVALATRAFYNIFLLEHRIVHFGDAYNFLRTGSALYETIASSSGVIDFIHKIFLTKPSSEHLMQSMKSLGLTDRLLIDGPIYPTYLAFIEWLSGINPFQPAFDNSAWQLCLCNSVTDAIVCVIIYTCGRLAFEKRVALVSALIFAFYPAFVINTQHCYSEPFSYFLLSAWTATTLGLLLRHRKRSNLAWLAIGILSGLLMLSKPAFIMLPPLVASAIAFHHLFFVAKNAASVPYRQGRFYLNGLLISCGLLLILGPWLCFNKTASGRYSLFVNRVPSFNLFHGNLLQTEGWLAYPFDGLFPGESDKVIASLAADAQKAPLDFVGLQFKKISRLWSGVWNEYQYFFFGIPYKGQSLIHQILLLFAVLGFEQTLFSSRNKHLSRSTKAGLVFGSIVIFHFVYIPFVAISRYAITAMPFVILLGSFSMVNICKQKHGFLKFSGLCVLATLIFWELDSSKFLANLFAAWLPKEQAQSAPWLSWALGSAGMSALIAAALYLKQGGMRLSGNNLAGTRNVVTLIFCLLTLSVSWFNTVASNNWKEWSVILPGNSGNKASLIQSIRLPSRPNCLLENGLCFVLVDLQTKVLAPRIKVFLNGRISSHEALPLAQLQPDNEDILQCLSLQAQGMGVDSRSFRQWWVVPFAESDLRWNNINELKIESLYPDDRIRVFGEYAFDKMADMPSLRSFSYIKGFSTFDKEDARINERIEIRGITVSSALRGQSTDLSEEPGKQYGRYRLRLLLPGQYHNEVSTPYKYPSVSQNNLLSIKTDWKVEGQNPYSFIPPGNSVPAGLPSGTRFDFGCEIKEIASSHHNAMISVSFSGKDASEQIINWNSTWQPAAIPISSERWIHTSFSDRIPDHILKLSNLQANIFLSPFQPDYLFLRKKQALRCKMLVRNIRLNLEAPLNLPSARNTYWLVY